MYRLTRHLGALLLAALPFASFATGFADCPQFFPSGRAPAAPAQPLLRELCFSEFAVLHSGMTKTPVYVAQRLNAQMLEQGRELKRHDRFYAEAQLSRAGPPVSYEDFVQRTGLRLLNMSAR